MHLVIIDALNLIRRIYAVQQRQHANEQQALMATSQGLSSAINKLISLLKPSHMVAVFDHSSSGQSWRQQLFPDYKAQRSPMPEALAAQLSELQDTLLQQGIDSIAAPKIEADDVCASIAVKAQQAGCLSTIVSTDQGYYALLEQGVQLYDYFQRHAISSQQVEQKLGIEITQITDYWSMVGITSLGIAGVAGVGKKTAQQLLQTYGSCEAMLRSDASDKALKKVQNAVDSLQLAQQLVQLKTDLNLGFSLKQLRLRT